ncbi:hypothetical protein D4T97_005070 [Siminovitchia acidinfaciens]|uniref:Uncharacterized protein n=1 Tax=Siminovitchia acidinfaciens TaxID=2321395 RepID=A0A429Y472_9BACI|nr:hypothetical protein [Siminovitchia acidinfaciens]RST76157.1 hypothetical protein D4T97_005070 [Siminovitchia acidinfaciens]
MKVQRRKIPIVFREELHGLFLDGISSYVRAILIGLPFPLAGKEIRNRPLPYLHSICDQK